MKSRTTQHEILQQCCPVLLIIHCPCLSLRRTFASLKHQFCCLCNSCVPQEQRLLPTTLCQQMKAPVAGYRQDKPFQQLFQPLVFWEQSLNSPITHVWTIQRSNTHPPEASCQQKRFVRPPACCVARPEQAPGKRKAGSTIQVGHIPEPLAERLHL